jgi:hypothetical protein
LVPHVGAPALQLDNPQARFGVQYITNRKQPVGESTLIELVPEGERNDGDATSTRRAYYPSSWSRVGPFVEPALLISEEQKKEYRYEVDAM